MSAPEPTWVGVGGRAWRLDYPAEVSARAPASVAAWLLCAPGSHMFWPWKVVAAVALRDFPGVPPAQLRFVGATHELNVISINPQRWPRPLEHWGEIMAGASAPYLLPFEASSQIVLRDDADGRELTQYVVRAFVDGLLVPDQDFRTHVERTIERTADCIRSGTHGEVAS